MQAQHDQTARDRSDDADARDAARYRFLRGLEWEVDGATAHSGRFDVTHLRLFSRIEVDPDWNRSFGIDTSKSAWLDAAIDLAMKEQGNGC